MTLDAWTTDRLIYLKALKSRTDQQELLVYLAQKPDRIPQDNRKLLMLVKAEKASVKAALARQQVATLLAAEKRSAGQAERKARNHRLIQQGVLFDLAGLANRSRGELLGLLIAAAATENETRWTVWKIRGDALLADIEPLKSTEPGNTQNVDLMPGAQRTASQSCSEEAVPLSRQVPAITDL